MLNLITRFNIFNGSLTQRVYFLFIIMFTYSKYVYTKFFSWGTLYNT